MDFDIDKLLCGIAEKLNCLRNEEAAVRATELYKEEVITLPTPRENKKLPRRISELKAFAKNTDNYRLRRDSAFLNQARFMEHYEDDFDERPAFHAHSPTYADMNDSQLRYYFTWRTRLRKGNYSRIGTSYVFVYIYELLSLVGVKDADEGLDKLLQLYNFVEEDSSDPMILLSYLKMWILDFFAYYGIDPKRLCELRFFGETQFSAIAVLMRYRKHTKEEIADSLIMLSAYNAEKSRFVAKYPEQYKSILAGVFISMSDYYANQRGESYVDHLAGAGNVAHHISIFKGAVFVPDVRKHYIYELNPALKYRTMYSGGWYKECCSLNESEKSCGVGKLLRTVDRIMRDSFGFPHPLKDEGADKRLFKTVVSEIEKYRLSEKEREMAKIRIDTALLPQIRKSADITRDRLIVEEENEEEPIPQFSAIAEKTPEGLSKTEAELLKLILKGERYRGSTPVSILCDSINEKLFERFSDTVIDFEEDKPYIIEDYKEELEKMLA